MVVLGLLSCLSDFDEVFIMLQNGWPVSETKFIIYAQRPIR